MLSNFKWRVPEDAGEEKLLSDVQKFGWHIVSVFDERKENPRPEFAYSVGLYFTHEHPEIVLTGLPQKKAGAIINGVGDYIKRGGWINPGDRYADFVEGFDVIFRLVRPERHPEYLGYAMWFYRSLPGRFPALQLIWPDKSGVFPWEDGFDQRYIPLQPQLW